MGFRSAKTLVDLSDPLHRHRPVFLKMLSLSGLDSLVRWCYSFFVHMSDGLCAKYELLALYLASQRHRDLRAVGGTLPNVASSVTNIRC